GGTHAYDQFRGTGAERHDGEADYEWCEADTRRQRNAATNQRFCAPVEEGNSGQNERDGYDHRSPSAVGRKSTGRGVDAPVTFCAPGLNGYESLSGPYVLRYRAGRSYLTKLNEITDGAFGGFGGCGGSGGEGGAGVVCTSFQRRIFR